MGGNAVTIPKGTKVSMYTHRPDNDPLTPPEPTDHESRVTVTMPNGDTYRSYDLPGEPRHTGNVLWAALYALTVNELDANAPTRASGNGWQVPDRRHHSRRTRRQPALRRPQSLRSRQWP
jgi:hypothetical protein